MNQSTKIFIGLGLGVVFGFIINIFAPDSAIQFLDKNILSVIGKGFIRLLQFIVVPLIFVALTLAMSAMGDLKKIGRYSIKLLGLYFFTSCFSITVGLFLAKILKPGAGVEMVHKEVSRFEGITIGEWILRILPKNPFEALSTGNILQIIVTALIVGLGITLARDKGKPLLSLFQSAYEVVKKMTELILKLIPFGVFALMASVIGTQGLGILKNLLLYVVGLIIGVFIVGVGLYSVMLLVARLSLIKYWKAFHPAFLFAFATASSGASLPIAMDNAEKRYGMREDILSFALPFGIAMKKDGAALLQSFSAIFVAQMAGIDLTTPQFMAIIIASLLVSFSTAGIPAGGLIMMTTVLTAAGLPLEGVVILAGLDRLTDTFRTSLNVIGPTANAAILEKWESRDKTTSVKKA